MDMALLSLLDTARTLHELHIHVIPYQQTASCIPYPTPKNILIGSHVHVLVHVHVHVLKVDIGYGTSRCE